MPKADRAAELKKQSAKERKKVSSTDLAYGAKPKVVEEVAAVPEPKRRSFAAANSLPASRKAHELNASNSKFAQAQRMDGIVGEADASDHSEPEEVSDVQVVSPQKQKVESKADLKKRQAKEKKEELAFLLEEENAAKRERIIRRFLMTIGIGFILDAVQGSGKPARASGKPEKKQKKDRPSKNGDSSEGFGHNIMKNIEVLAGPFAMLMLCVAIFAMRVGEAGHRGHARSDVDYYEAMGVPRDAGVLDIRKAYKRLALTWHPDKHPDCEACPEKFARISEANEVLSNPDRRKAYDQRANSDGQVRSEASVDLADDFAAKVLSSNEIWVVQVYDPGDDGTQSFHAIWEDVAHSHKSLARFGRLDMVQHSAVLSLLPQRVLVSPTIFRLGRGLLPEVFVPAWQGNPDEGAAPLSRFVSAGYPQAKHLGSDVTSWWKRDRPRVLLVGPQPGARGAKRDYAFQVQHVAHTWAEFFDFASADAKAADSLDGLEPAKGSGWSFALKPGGNKKPQRVEVDDPRDLASQLQLTLEIELGDQAPFVTVRNQRQLCEAGGEGQYNVRTFCLVMVDTPDASVAKMVEQLESSRQAYRQELKELSSSESDEEVTEEIFRVQPVRIATSASRLPWRPDCPNMAAFREIWGKVDRAPAFVVELESRRVAAVKSKGFGDLFQNIAYEDLKFMELPETVSVFHALPDPELPLSTVLRRVLTTGPGALVALLVLALATAVLPEMELLTATGTMGVSLTVFLLCWPAACRRFLSWMTF